MVTAALGFAAEGARAREIEQEQVREASEGRDAWWPLQRVPSHNAAQPRCVHTTWWPRPVAGQPRRRPIQSV